MSSGRCKCWLGSAFGTNAWLISHYQNLWYIGNKSTGQKRQCKDFSKLDEWALQHHACYNFEKPMKPGQLDVEAFTNCRQSSPYLQTMKDHFGYGENWQGDYPPHEGPTFDT